MTTADGRSFARRTALIALGQGAVKSCQLVLAVLLVRLLSPVDWNQTAVLLSIYLAAITLGTLNLQHGIFFFLPRVDGAARRPLVIQTAAAIAASGAIVATGLLLVAPHLDGGAMGIGRWLPWLGLAIAVELPSACTPAALIATERIGLAATWDVVTTLVLLGCIVVPAALGEGVGGVVIGILVSASIRLVAFIAVVLRWFPGPRRGLPSGTLVAQLRYGVPLGLTIAASVLNRSVDKWFIAWLRPHDVGIYTVAAQEIPLLAVLPYAGGAAVVTTVVDAFRRGDLATARDAWLRQTAAMSTVVVPLSAALLVVAPEVIALAFTDQYTAGVLPFQLFTAITLHRVAEYGLVLRAAGRGRELLRAALLLLTANTVLAGVGAAVGGMIGASIGTLVANAIAWWFVLGTIAEVFGTTRRGSFAWSTWSRSLAVASVAGAVAWVIGDAITDRPIGRLVAKVAVFALVDISAMRLVGSDVAIGRTSESSMSGASTSTASVAMAAVGEPA